MAGRRKRTAAPKAPKTDTGGQAIPEPADDGPDSDAGLSPREVIFCEELAKGSTSCQAAKLVGVCERTARRWRLRPAIQAAVRARMNDALASARAILAQGSALAARQLVELAEVAAPDAARVAACRVVIEESAKLGEIQELGDRLAELESRLAGRK